jgi:hypothetical protein
LIACGDDGLSYHQIMERLGLPQRTFQRYISEIFDHDNRLLVQTIYDEEALTQMSICKERLIKQRQEILEEIANNPNADFKARVQAHHLAGEIAAVVMKLYTEAPSMLAQRHRFPRTSLTEPESSGLRLKVSTALPYSIEEEEEQEQSQQNEPSEVIESEI